MYVFGIIGLLGFSAIAYFVWPAGTQALSTTFNTDTAARLIHEQINSERTSANLQEVSWQPEIADIVRLHGLDMALKGYVSHTSQEGLSPTQRASAYGYSCRMYENIYWQDYSAPNETVFAKSVVDYWMASSEGHKENILMQNVSREGIGVVIHNNEIFVVQGLC